MRVTLLSQHLSVLSSQALALQQAAADHPVDSPCVFSDLYADGADDLRGLCAEADERTSALRHAWTVGHLRGVQQHLSALTGTLEKLRTRLTLDLLYPRVLELMLLGEERGGEWLPWSEAVRTATEGCLEPLVNCERALTACWEDLTTCLLSSEQRPALHPAPVLHPEEPL